MADEPTLPALSNPRHNPFNEESRKRPRSERAPPSQLSTSSDPAFFSSDDDPALDNYEQKQGRRKRKYVGTWFSQQPAFSSDSFLGDDMISSEAPRPNTALAKPARREFRKLDSGIYMSQNEDSMAESSDNSGGTNIAPRPTFSHTRAKPRPIATGEQIAMDRIIECVEDGRETVDLSGLGLVSISDGILESISHIAPIPIVDKDVFFEQRDPQIKLFLSNNQLTKFPRCLLNVEHLTDLSLRANNLTEIPAGIAKLKNLQSLNIAQNQIKYLPFEFLQLFRKGSKLRSLQIQPNPLWFPDEWHDGPDEFAKRVDQAKRYAALAGSTQPDTQLESNWTGLMATIHRRSRVEFIDSSQRISGFRLPSTDRPLRRFEMEPFYKLAGPPELRRQRPGVSTIRLLNCKGARSLFEYALAACAGSSEADDLCQWLETEQDRGLPEGMSAALREAIKFSRDGRDLKCSMCGRKTVMPMTRWVEYYFINPTTVEARSNGENSTTAGERLSQISQAEMYPFMRFGCSWTCVPPTIERIEGEDEVEVEEEEEDEDTIIA